ncbi:ABC-F family ATP-binding cassette domain-containing protein [Hutsoniella sourekii]|uniref:ABC-F family ATP-binding cassette domain-containing protein n=1 Tax=Hutsoniella sourekii TaxID=87650 RepID=UPI0004813BAA|nr:ABC-F family ATP-binding cassette domain-containing protein [Hutsoniella sourekii]
MKELAITNLHKTYGTKELLSGVDLKIRTGDRVGLIGPNGTGKSSFLKVIAGLDNYDQGEISHPNQYSIAYLSQHPDLDPDQTVLETVYQSESPLVQLVLDYQQVSLALAEDPTKEAIQDRFNQVSEAMNRDQGWDMEVKAKTILSQLGISDLDKRVGQASGGQQKRIGLAQVLIAEPDLLILDEPTNHLDVDSIQWLEKYLANYKGALLLVTHDRYFLDRVVNQIVELRNGQLEVYPGNYQAYLVQRAERAEILAKQQDKQDRLYQQELAWMRAGAKARTTKQQARIDRFNDLSDSIKGRHQDPNNIELNFDQARMGNQVLEMEGVSVSINNQPVIRDFTRHFVKGDRVGLVGPNGVGKSTFLNTIAGLHPIDSGVYKMGQTVKLAYYRQLDQDLPGDMRVLAYLSEVADQFKRPDGSVASASSMLEQFNFPRITHGNQIKTLSGGERRRLYLLTLLIQEPNVLLLDEPTNDLDIDTLTVLEDYLDHFQGVVIVVSHDRYFLDKTVDKLLVLKGQGDYDFYYGSYSEYLASQEANSKEEAKTSSASPSPASEAKAKKPAPEKKRMTYQEKKEWVTLEDDIFELEARQDEIGEEMLTHSHDAGRLMELQRELDSNKEQLDHYYERYDYLSGLSQ